MVHRLLIENKVSHKVLIQVVNKGTYSDLLYHFLHYLYQKTDMIKYLTRSILRKQLFST